MIAVIVDKKLKQKEEQDSSKCPLFLILSSKGSLSIISQWKDKKSMTEWNFLLFLTLTIILKDMIKFLIN